MGCLESSHLMMKSFNGLPLESSAAALQSLLISTYELRFAPCIRRLEGQRKAAWGKSEVP
jgi:hypothetical protein